MTLDESSCSPVDTPSAERPARAHGGGPAFSIDLEVRTEPGSRILLLRFIGEIDVSAVPAVRDALAAARGAASYDVVVDLAALEFCCVRGFALLGEAAEAAASAGTGFSVSGLDPQLDRIRALVWPDGAAVSHPSTAAAISALRAGRAVPTLTPTWGRPG
jgi:anti-anti-sigma factor